MMARVSPMVFTFTVRCPGLSWWRRSLMRIALLGVRVYVTPLQGAE